MSDTPAKMTTVTYQTGYRVTDDGDIVRHDGSPIDPGTFIPDEHLRIAAERKRRAMRQKT